MDTTKLYGEAYSQSKVSEAAFCRAYNEAVRYLLAKYGEKNVSDGSGASLFVKKAGEKTSLRCVYFGAVCAYISFSVTKDEAKKAEFMQCSDDAYCNVWRERIKGARVRGCRF
ncbi:MAG: hypothetical protein UHG68_03335 [Clostridia bacterium]|nr:hypothetical protein [Clostridia bacterium]